MYSFLSNSISIVFHPLWIPLLSFFLFTHYDHSLVYSDDVEKSVLLLLGINVVLPGLSIYYLIKKGILSDLELTNRKERLLPYLLIIFYYIIFYVVVCKLNPYISSLIYSMFLAIIASLLIAMTINLYWKISVHLMGIGGVSGALLGLLIAHPESNVFFPFILSILIAGWLGFSRIYLKAHTTNQVYAGYLLGFGIQVLFVSQKIHIPLF